MRFQEIQERCWTGYQQQGMKKKGNRQVPNCVPVEEVKTGPEITGRDLLFKAAAMAMLAASQEGQSLDYEQAIRQASKIYGIPYQPSELPRLLAQRAEIDRQLALLKQGKQVARARRKEKLAPTPAGTDEYWKTHALPTDRIKPATKSLEEAMDTFLDNTARELLGLVIIAGGAFAVGTYYTILNKLKKYQGRQIIDALEQKGVTMNRQTYEQVKPLLNQFRQALNDNDGEQAKMLAKRIEQMIVMGKLSAPEPQSADAALAAKERELEEDLKKWFKEKWVRFGPDGKIRGDCARGSSSEGKPKCLPQAKAQALGKKGRASSAAKKRREDPDPERRGAAKNVATRVNEFAPGAGDDNEPDFNPETFYDIPKLKKVYKQLASRSVNSGWYDFQLTRLIGAMEDLYTINADVLDDMFPTAPEIANYIERNIIKAFPSETPPYIIKNPDYKPRAPRAPRPGMVESRGGNYEELGLRKSSADRFAVLDRTLDAVIMTTNDLKSAKQEAIEWADYDDIRTEIIDQATGKKIFAVDGNAGAMKYLDEKQDACYSKVKSRYKVWPSAYASGALVQCRKKGAANWGNKKK